MKPELDAIGGVAAADGTAGALSWRSEPPPAEAVTAGRARSPDPVASGPPLDEVGLVFEVNRESRELVIKIVDRETRQVIRQIPAEEVRQLRATMQEILGLLLDRTG
jgi:flagellar protein FlaG